MVTHRGRCCCDIGTYVPLQFGLYNMMSHSEGWSAEIEPALACDKFVGYRMRGPGPSGLSNGISPPNCGDCGQPSWIPTTAQDTSLYPAYLKDQLNRSERMGFYDGTGYNYNLLINGVWVPFKSNWGRGAHSVGFPTRTRTQSPVQYSTYYNSQTESWWSVFTAWWWVIVCPWQYTLNESLHYCNVEYEGTWWLNNCCGTMSSDNYTDICSRYRPNADHGIIYHNLAEPINETQLRGLVATHAYDYENNFNGNAIEIHIPAIPPYGTLWNPSLLQEWMRLKFRTWGTRIVFTTAIPGGNYTSRLALGSPAQALYESQWSWCFLQRDMVYPYDFTWKDDSFASAYYELNSPQGMTEYMYVGYTHTPACLNTIDEAFPIGEWLEGGTGGGNVRVGFDFALNTMGNQT